MAEEWVIKPPSMTIPSVHEDVFVPRGYEDDTLILEVRTALGNGRNAAERAFEITSAILANQMLMPAARHREARNKSFAASEPAMKRMQAVNEKLTAKIGAMEKVLHGPNVKSDAVTALTLMEVRTALSNLPPEQRRPAILEAIKNGDEMTVAAVLHGPWYLGNRSPEEQQQFRLDWQRLARPKEAAYLDALKQAEEHLMRGGQLLMGYVNGLTDYSVIKAAEQTEKRAADATAAALSAALH